ncbi:type II toxin-antitoxin system VapC family toxin [Candidatus Woesearchaeota archaeon]|nr:type II toxin-antitoxin system VapC family toxin [Candidatus Woesearchaeota archaeon]
MAGQICLDTSVCIELVKRNSTITGFIEEFFEATAFLPSVTAFELLLRSRNLEDVKELIQKTKVLDFTKEAAEEASNIEKDLKSRGALIGREDIFIAATAMVNNCALATLNTKDFSRIKGLKLVRLR